MPRYSLAALFASIAIACAEGADESAAPDTGPAAFPQPEPLPDVDPSTLPRVDAQLGVPPRAAPPTGRTSAAHVVIDLEVRELTREIADGATYTFWTFGGTVPGPMIRVGAATTSSCISRTIPTTRCRTTSICTR